jgi:hypothetical protein
LHQSIEAWLRRHAMGAESTRRCHISRAARAAILSRKKSD